MSEPKSVREVGEQGLLKRLQAFCPANVVGDDAALLPVAEGYALVVTTDLLVDRVHFSEQTTRPADVGWRSAAANLSDLAAMGADPLGITVGLALPGELAVTWVEQLYQGMVACLQQYNTAIVGGDICRSSVAMISITALGQVLPRHAIRRSVAQPGDAIVVTGVHGASRAGLDLLLHPEQGQNLSERDRACLIQAHQRPKPRLDVIPILRKLLEAEWESRGDQMSPDTRPLPPDTPSPTPAIPIAGMDSSDGLADAVLQVCRESQVGAQLERQQIPLPLGLVDWVGEAKAIEWALYGGEDFELVLCLPEVVAQKLVEQLGNGAAIVGRITAEPEVILRDRNGVYPDEVLTLDRGFQHF